MSSSKNKLAGLVAVVAVVLLVLSIGAPRKGSDFESDSSTTRQSDSSEGLSKEDTEYLQLLEEVLSDPANWGEESEALNDFKMSCTTEDGYEGAYVDQEGMFILDPKQTEGKECALCTSRNTQSRDNCIRAGNAKGKTCKTVTQGGRSIKYCCDWTAKGECECEKEYKNPCTDPIKCLACMVMGEAEGQSACEKNAVACVARNRMNADDNMDDFCEVVSKQTGDTTEWEPYKCVCDSGPNANARQTYCDCCADPDPGQTYGQNYQDALAAANAAGGPSGCPGVLGKIDAFGANGNKPSHCSDSDEVDIPNCNTTHKFYDCE